MRAEAQQVARVGDRRGRSPVAAEAQQAICLGYKERKEEDDDSNLTPPKFRKKEVVGVGTSILRNFKKKRGDGNGKLNPPKFRKKNDENGKVNESDE